MLDKVGVLYFDTGRDSVPRTQQLNSKADDCYMDGSKVKFLSRSTSTLRAVFKEGALHTEGVRSTCTHMLPCTLMFLGGVCGVRRIKMVRCTLCSGVCTCDVPCNALHCLDVFCVCVCVVRAQAALI